MKLAKILFPILGSVAMLPMTGLTSCGNGTPFVFDPDIRNVQINETLAISSAGSYPCLSCHIPITVSLKDDKQFSDKDELYVTFQYPSEMTNYEVLEGEEPNFSHVCLLHVVTPNPGNFDLSIEFAMVFRSVEAIPKSRFKLKFKYKYKASFTYVPSGEEDQNYKINNCSLAGTVEYTPSEVK